MNFYFIPLNKYDTVIEHFDGSITVPKHEKKRYLYVCQEDYNIFLLNNIDGCLYHYSMIKNTTLQLNSNNTYHWNNLIGIAIHSNCFISFDPTTLTFNWFHKENFELIHSIQVDFEVNNFTIKDNIIWACDRKKSALYKISLNNLFIDKIEQLKYKGIGHTSLLICNNELYITDSEENTLRGYSLNGELIYESICPFFDPIGQVMIRNEHFILYGGLVNEVGYENRCWQEQKPFFHAIKINVEIINNIKIISTNSFIVDFFYEEHFNSPIQERLLPMTIQIALPPDTPHQKLIDATPLGLPFEIIYTDKKPFAQYTITHPYTKAIGYKATLQLKSIKYNTIYPHHLQLKKDCVLSQIEMEELNIDNPYVNQFIFDITPEIEKVKKIRNTLYSKLYYKKNIYAQSFEEVLKDGYGTCGDYASLLLILLTKNNISCQSVSGYKIPRFYISQSGIMSVYFNHTWIEVFDHNSSTIFPIESSSDDKEFESRFCEGQFLGIDWTHIQLYEGKAYPNLIKIISHPELHPFDVLKKASVFAKIIKEL